MWLKYCDKDFNFFFGTLKYYEKTKNQWTQRLKTIPPCFIRLYDTFQ